MLQETPSDHKLGSIGSDLEIAIRINIIIKFTLT